MISHDNKQKNGQRLSFDDAHCLGKKTKGSCRTQSSGKKRSHQWITNHATIAYIFGCYLWNTYQSRLKKT